MNMPAHRPSTDDAGAPRSRRRVVITVICIVIVLGSLHLLREALG